MMIKKVSEYGTLGSGNYVIQGDNVIVTKELYEEVGNIIKCIYIDPPYNNDERYHHYNDRQKHEEWIAYMRSILPNLFSLLTDDGSIWISIDDNEVHYLKVLCDELFGHDRFISTIIWEHRKSRENRSIFSNNHEYILVYSKDPKKFKKSRNLLPLKDSIPSVYRNPDNDPRGPWQSVTVSVQAGHAVPSQFYEIVSPSGKHFSPPKGRCWIHNEERMKEEISKNNIWFGINGDSAPRKKLFLKDAKLGLIPQTLWNAEEVGTTEDSKKQLLELLPSETVFDTPKPEFLIKKIIEIASNPGDYILDAFLGSGTTATTSLKMNRKFYGIDCSEKSIDYAKKRIKLTIEGEQTGISKITGWKGGNGFVYSVHQE